MEMDESSTSERIEEESEDRKSDGSESNEDDVDNVNYKMCCLYDKKDNKCGPYLRDRSVKSGLVAIVDLTADTESHFKNLSNVSKRFKTFQKLLCKYQMD